MTSPTATEPRTAEFPSSPWIAPPERDLGFGTVVASETRTRLLNRDGTFNVRREGTGFWRSLSLYNWLLQISWPQFFLLVVASFVAVNVLFAGAYYAAGAGAPSEPGLSGPLPAWFFFAFSSLACGRFCYRPPSWVG